MNTANFGLAVKGAAKSVTIWCAAILAVLSEATPLLTPDFLRDTLSLHPETIQKFGGAMALAIVVLRAVTTQSLANKGAGTPPQPPPPPEPPAKPGPTKVSP